MAKHLKGNKSSFDTAIAICGATGRFGRFIAWHVPLLAWIESMTWTFAVSGRCRLYTDPYTRHTV